MKFLLPTLLFISLCGSGLAQTGHYYVSHYSSERQAASLSFDMAQDAAGLMYFATRTGLKQFDGRYWKTVGESSVIYTLSQTEDGTVWAGGEGIIGMVSTGQDFSLQLKPVVKEPAVNFFESIALKGEILFLSEQKIVIYNAKTNTTKQVKLPEGKEGFTNLFEIFTIPYVSTFDGTIYKIEGDKLTESKLPIKSPVAFTAGLNNQYFIITEDHEFLLYNADKGIRPVTLEDATYLRSGVIVSGVWVNEKLVALGTLNGGVVFINPTTGKTEEMINYYSGLPDNEVFCMKRDAEGNVWIGHEYGYSCISPNLPFRSFNHYAGLNGNILCAKTFNSKVYVGTSVGLFVLETQDQYGEEIYYVEKRSAAKGSTTSPVVAAEPEQESKKRGFLRFRKKKEEEKPVEAATPKQQEQVPSVTRVRQTRKILLGTTYSFKQVGGIDSKVERLITYNKGLYAAGLAGLFRIENNKAIALVQEPVEVIAATAQHGIVGETYRNRVFAWDGKVQTTLVEDIRDDISSIVEDKDGVLWVAGTKNLYRLSAKNTVENFSFSNPSLDHTEGMNLNGQPLFVNSNGFYTYSSGAVRVIDSLGKPTHFFATGTNLWYRRNETWRCLGSFQEHENLEYLNVFEDLRYVEAEEQTEMLWIVTKDNELFKFYSNRLVPQSTVYPLLVRYVRNQQQFFEPGMPVYKVEQHEGQLTIEVVQATFGSQHGAQYRFSLQGLDTENWSEWTNENQFSFPYLPLGNYSIKFQTRDILGKINELKPIRLKIEPPFWKTPWFYAMEFALFSVLVVLSMRLQAMNNKYRMLAQVLSMLTIVLLITLIQAAVSTYFVTTSPVTDFAIQVGIAFLILPVEIFLRKLMFSTGEKNKLYQIINPTLKRPTNG